MSKLYDKYEKLKIMSSDTIYLFLCGNFYIALDSDAMILNELFNFKLTKFSNLCDKCGFPKNAINKYKIIFEEKNIKYKIIEQVENNNEYVVNSIKKMFENYEINKLNNNELLELVLNIKKLI